MTRIPILGLALAAALAACGGDDDGDSDSPDDGGELPTDPPEEVEMVASGGFTDPMDAVASLDGTTFYFSAFTPEDGQPAIFSVPAAGGEVTMLAGGPPLENPAGLLLSADGGALLVADIGVRAGELGEDAEASTQSVMYSLSLGGGGALASVAADGIAEAAGLALGPDGETIHVTGYNAAGLPGLFRLPAGGGAAEEILVGAPLESPTGVYVDSAGVSWVMDHHPSRGLGGALWAVTPEGEASEVVGNLGLADPGGVSLVAGGGTAVIPNTTEDGAGQLTAVNIDSGEQTIVASPMKAPAGIRTAREAGVFAIADSEGDAIYLAR